MTDQRLFLFRAAQSDEIQASSTQPTSPPTGEAQTADVAALDARERGKLFLNQLLIPAAKVNKFSPVLLCLTELADKVARYEAQRD